VRVYTFYEPIKGYADAAPLINLWQESWARNGWKTEVLDEEDAIAHPDYEVFLEAINTFPTTNDRRYENACYIRWLAMALLEDSLAVMSDYDCFNRSFSPDAADAIISNRNLLLLEPTRVPCAVLGSPIGFEMFAREITNCRANGQAHVSDMTIARKSRVPTAKICVEWGCSGTDIPNDLGEGWRNAPLVHFATESFNRRGIRGGSKVDKIKEQLKLLDK
jgi:hypothetical protein